MSYVNNLDLCSDMWSKFKHLYWDTNFMEWDTIFFWLSNKIAADFEDVAHFVNSLKCDSIQWKEIGTKDVPDWMFITWLFHSLILEYNSFSIMLNNNRKAKQAKKQKTEPDFGSILEQILNLNTQKKTNKAQLMKSASKPRKKQKSSTKPSSPVTLKKNAIISIRNVQTRIFGKGFKIASRNFILRLMLPRPKWTTFRKKKVK